MSASAIQMSDVSILTHDDFDDGGPISLDEIENGLYLGNLSAATHMETLKSFNITHILTLDSIPLAKHITEAAFLTTKYIQIADIPKEDILHHLDACVEFICSALQANKNILVHCYFGVSRSSTVVIAYLMKEYNLDYITAFERVKSKRRFVQPNAGFIAQLKLWHYMGCRIDPNCQKYKMYRLSLAGEQVRKAKILPQNFSNVIKPDPAVQQENPEPIVYRCRKCRRILASNSNVLNHVTSSHSSNMQTKPNDVQPASNEQQSSSLSLLEQISSDIRQMTLTASSGTTATTTRNSRNSHLNNSCSHVVFVEPIAWMSATINHNTQGRLNCPQCHQKLGNFSWINGCQCSCGKKMSPAFYFVTSKVELSKAVQNIQTTL